MTDIAITGMEDGIRVDLTWIGEGIQGDYDERDPEDVKLMRFYVQQFNPKTEEWDDVEDASYCTRIGVDEDILMKASYLGKIYKGARQYLNGDASRRVFEELSWLGDSI